MNLNDAPTLTANEWADMSDELLADVCRDNMRVCLRSANGISAVPVNARTASAALTEIYKRALAKKNGGKL